MPTLVIKNPDGSQQEQEVAEQLTVGRSEGNDLILSEGGVSRKHARFFVEGGACMVEDAGSANGTWVDGEKIEGPTRLTSKSTIVIGDYELQLKVGSKSLPKASKVSSRSSDEPTAAQGKAQAPYEDVATVPRPRSKSAPRATRVVEAISPPSSKGSALARRPGAQRATGPQLRGLTGAITGKIFPLSGTVTVGRVAGVDVQIDDDSVSRRHAELAVEGRQVTLRDLGSANGTTVNGAPVSGDTALSSGDIIQFGVVEVMFETSAGGAARAPIARGRGASEPGARPVRASREVLDGVTSESAALDPKKRRLVIGGVVVVGLLFALVLAKAISAPPAPVDQGLRPLAGGGGPRSPRGPVAKDPATQIEEYLAECRTYSNIEGGSVDWQRADTACQKVMELEPIHPEANSLVKRISVLKVCEQNLNAGKEQVAGGQLEAALETLAKIGKSCESYLLRALSASKEPLAEVKKRAGADCKLYASNARWDYALKRCELYARLACQSMEPKELYPPALTRLKLDGPLNPKTEWRPADPLYINFLKAREKAKPGEPMWTCPELPAFRPPPPPPDPRKLAVEELQARYKEEPEFGRALVAYFVGDFQTAPVPLMKLVEKIEKVQYHELARSLLLDINTAINLYENGTTEITNDRPDKAEQPFLKALAVDERLVLGDRAAKLSPDDKKRELERRASFIRKAIVDTMSAQSYEKGRALADRKDFRAACRFWKLGNNFSRSNIDLLKALTNVCTRRAEEAYGRAQSCEQFKVVLDFAVDGDGFKEKVLETMKEQGCE